jgi:hypothetical protein
MPLSAANAERLQRVLSVLDPAKGAAAEVRADGYLWMRSSPSTKRGLQALLAVFLR